MDECIQTGGEIGPFFLNCTCRKIIKAILLLSEECILVRSPCLSRDLKIPSAMGRFHGLNLAIEILGRSWS